MLCWHPKSLHGHYSFHFHSTVSPPLLQMNIECLSDHVWNQIEIQSFLKYSHVFLKCTSLEVFAIIYGFILVLGYRDTALLKLCGNELCVVINCSSRASSIWNLLHSVNQVVTIETMMSLMFSVFWLFYCLFMSFVLIYDQSNIYSDYSKSYSGFVTVDIQFLKLEF